MLQKAISFIGVAGLLAIGTLAIAAQEGAAFYEGKTVNYVVATEPGGGYDTNGRLLARFMQKHLPGSTFVVRNMPGAGHMIGANYIYNAEPDGLTLGTFNTGLIYSQLTGDTGAHFNLSKMDWVGKLASDPRVILLDKTIGIESFEQLRALDAPIRFSAAGVSSASTVETTLLVDALDLQVEIITGYDGSEGLLAMRRGEVQGMVGSRSSLEPFVTDGFGVFVAQIGGSQTDLPQLTTLAEGNKAGQRAIALIASQGNISRLTAATPGVPEDRLEALRAAYQAAVTDPEFLAEAEAQGLPVDPLVGDVVGEEVAAALDQTPEMIEFLKSTLED